MVLVGLRLVACITAVYKGNTEACVGSVRSRPRADCEFCTQDLPNLA